MRKNFTLTFIFLILAGITIPSSLHSVPPFGIKNPLPQTCFVNREAAKVRLAARLKYAPGFAPPISTTTYKVIVVRIDFPDKAMTKTKAQTQTFFDSLKSFYLEDSFNYLIVNATLSDGGSGFAGAFRMPKNYSIYANGINSDYAGLAKDAIALATTSGLNFSSYDHVMFYHSGDGAETTSNANIWSVYAPGNFLNGPTASGKTFPGATFVPETEGQGVDPLGVICHEYGHQQGLPDLYNTASGATQVGKWSLMDGGVYVGTPPGSNPAHHDAWCKLFLGFSSPQTISFTQGTNVSLNQAEMSRTSFIKTPLIVSDVGENEYFLFEYRRTSGSTYDNGIPGQGLMIWHVDDSIASDSTHLANNDVNNNSSRRGISVVSADGSDPSTNGGDAGDSWPGSSNNLLFNAPKSNSLSGKESGIEASNIGSAGSSSLSFTIKSIFGNPIFASITQPGSAVVTGGAGGYVNPSQNEAAQIKIIPTGAGTIETKIYSLNGDLVYEDTRSGTASVGQVIAWNGRNTDGNVVPSGIYTVSIKGGGLDVKKKIAILK